MIFGRKSSADQELVLIGLSADNVEKMQEGKPLSVGPVPKDNAMSKMRIIVLIADTEKDIVDKLKAAGLVSEDQTMNDLL